MRARTERAAAHAALTSLKASIDHLTFYTASERDLLRTALLLTEPRPWWRFW